MSLIYFFLLGRNYRRRITVSRQTSFSTKVGFIYALLFIYFFWITFCHAETSLRSFEMYHLTFHRRMVLRSKYAYEHIVCSTSRIRKIPCGSTAVRKKWRRIPFRCRNETLCVGNGWRRWILLSHDCLILTIISYYLISHVVYSCFFFPVVQEQEACLKIRSLKICVVSHEISSTHHRQQIFGPRPVDLHI
jgi:hypothetical protein